MATKTPNQTGGYYAVRNGKHVRTCIFMFWQDCKDHVDGYPEAEYAVFDNINEAVDYTLDLPASVTLNMNGRDIDISVAATDNNNNNKNNNNGGESSVQLPFGVHDPSHNNMLLSPSPPAHPQNLKHSSVGGGILLAPKPNNDPVTGTNSANNNNNNNNVVGLVDEWEKGNTPTGPVPPITGTSATPRNISASAMAIAIAPRVDDNDGDVEAAAAAAAASVSAKRQKLYHEQQQQQQSSSSYNNGGNITTTTTNSIVFQSPASRKTPPNTTNKHTTLWRKPTRKWEEMFDKLKQYKEQHNTFDVSTNPDYADVRAWVNVQRTQYKAMKEYKKSSMTIEKVERLQYLGFDFGYVSWDDRLEELKLYKQQHGTLCCTCPTTPDGAEDPKYVELSKWFQKQREQCGLFLKGKQCNIGKGQMERLFALGLDPADVASTVTKSKRSSAFSSDKWDAMFDSLREYKNQHGNCKVPVTMKTPLSKWVTTQRVEYKKLQDGKKSRLTLPQLQKLNDLGFVFQQCERYIRFDDWLDRLKEYKNEHGDCRVPKKSHLYPELGNWVCRQRQEYKRYMDGISTTMTEERIRQLTDIGFVFQAGKRLQIEHGEKKSWDERFEELLVYKRENGHTIVPQNYPKLGEWVKTQRKNYKYLKDGKKTSMSTEQALKLADVGFVFDATNRRGKNA